MNKPDTDCSPVQIVDQPFATDGSETPFGQRWGGEYFTFTAEHLAALQAGQTLALDVLNEYVAFVRLAADGQRRVPACGDLGEAEGAGV